MLIDIDTFGKTPIKRQNTARNNNPAVPNAILIHCHFKMYTLDFAQHPAIPRQRAAPSLPTRSLPS
ncbi:hypothetical protein [Burkholderia cenocepacia]|uniref:hypothetical protein n=1 Tax=Burkholderia cenocepacia TaxID=95486 RepID=UPI00406CC19B